MKTPIQTAIEQIEEAANLLPLEAGYYKAGMLYAVKVLKEATVGEREAIEGAYLEGCVQTRNWFENAEQEQIAQDYFTQTYNEK